MEEDIQNYQQIVMFRGTPRGVPRNITAAGRIKGRL